MIKSAGRQEPRLPIAFTRFRLAWRWEGEEALIASRATDETGYVQPTRAHRVDADVALGSTQRLANHVHRPVAVRAGAPRVRVALTR